MMRALFTAASGMQTQQLNLDNISNNMSNVNTSGFKKSRIEFQDLLYEHLRLPGTIDQSGQQIPVGLEIGNGAKPAATQKIFTQGELQNSGNTLDLAIKGDGFYQIEMTDGSVEYTRDASFKKDSTGRIVTSDGHYLVPAITIPSAATDIIVSETGQVSVTLPNTEGNQIVGQLQLTRFSNPAGLASQGNNLYTATEASGDPTTSTPGSEGLGTIQQKYLEVSNVKTVEEMVNLIMTQRAYEVNTKAIQAADDMLSQANNLRR